MRWKGSRRSTKYNAKKATCSAGHTHDSIGEAKRCDELHLMQRAGEISDLSVSPVYRFILPDGKAIKMKNGQVARYTADFQYMENGRQIVEDFKGFIARDFPLRRALFEALFPDITLRVVGLAKRKKV